MLGDDVGVFTHSVLTNVMMNEAETEQRERETIVFRRGADGRWLAVHEHLSPAP
jgi:ketosteroid isomerase-like protein